MSRTVWLALALAAVGAGLIAVGVVVGSPRVGVAATYVNPGYGTGRSSLVSVVRRPPLLDPADGNLWLGAGIVLCVLALAALALARVAPRSPEPRPHTER